MTPALNSVLTALGERRAQRDKAERLGLTFYVAQYRGMIEDERRELDEMEKRPERERFHVRIKSDEYQPFDRSNVKYDDIQAHVAAEMAKHNRLALILQGLLDRSPVFHPHPQWSLWSQEGFEQAMALIYDDARALVAGAKPDFEAYRRRLNASIRPGSMTVGQYDRWVAYMREKSAERDSRLRGLGWSPPYGNPGPSRIHMVSERTRRGQCTFVWTRERQVETRKHRCGSPIPTSFTTHDSGLLHVNAYTSGDFRQFFDDPRTRAEYLKWAPYLLAAEEWHAGNLDGKPPKRKSKRRPEASDDGEEGTDE